jgi:hypothetical protein
MVSNFVSRSGPLVPVYETFVPALSLTATTIFHTSEAPHRSLLLHISFLFFVRRLFPFDTSVEGWQNMFTFRRKPKKEPESPRIRTSPSLPELNSQGIPWPEDLVDINAIRQEPLPEAVPPQGAAKTSFQATIPISLFRSINRFGRLQESVMTVPSRRCTCLLRLRLPT